MWVLWILSMLNTISCIYNDICHIVSKLRSAIQDTFSDQLYVFFGEKPFAYRSNRVVTGVDSSAHPSWLYNATEGCFHEWCGSLFSTKIKGERKRSFPLLSLEIMEGQSVAYDLTDFIEKLCVYTEVDAVATEELYPTIEQVIAAWSTGSHIIVDESRHHIRMMDTSAEVSERGFHEVTEEDVDIAPPAWPPSPSPQAGFISTSCSEPEECPNPVAED